MRKIVVTYLASSLERSGPTEVLVNLLHGLDRSSYVPQVVTLSPEPENSSKSLIQSLGVNVLTLGLSRIGFFFKARKLLLAHETVLESDIVHSYGVRADTLSARVLAGRLPCVSTSHNNPFIDYPLAYGKGWGHMMAYQQIAAFCKLNHIVSISSEMASFLGKWGIRTSLIHNGILMPERGLPTSEEVRAIRLKLGLNPESRLFLVVGALIRRKNVQTVLQAYQASSTPNSQLIILGDGTELEMLRESYGKFRDIIFRGRVENVSEYMSCADCFISASTAEGFPMAVLEAASHGLHLFLSGIDPHREIVERLGSGSLFASQSELVRQLHEPIERKHSSFELAEKARVFDCGNVAREYETLYQRMVTSFSQA